MTDIPQATHELMAVGQLFHQRGWSVGTSSNYSALVVEPADAMLITVSGKDKGRLVPQDFVLLNRQGQPLSLEQPASSAETALHAAIYETTPATCVLHTHSVWGTILSEKFFRRGYVEIGGFEMLKGLADVTTHEHVERIAIFENTQHVPQLATEVRSRIEEYDPGLAHAFLIRRHGLYTWGSSIAEARRHVEVLEFLFECIGRELAL